MGVYEKYDILINMVMKCNYSLRIFLLNKMKIKSSNEKSIRDCSIGFELELNVAILPEVIIDNNINRNGFLDSTPGFFFER